MYIFIFRKIEMEQKRKVEEFERRRQEEEDLKAAVALQVNHCYYSTSILTSIHMYD